MLKPSLRPAASLLSLGVLDGSGSGLPFGPESGEQEADGNP
jgi:hypothetical protein